MSTVAFFKFFVIDSPTFSPVETSDNVLTPALRADFFACLINFLPVLLLTAFLIDGMRKFNQGLKNLYIPRKMPPNPRP